MLLQIVKKCIHLIYKVPAFFTAFTKDLLSSFHLIDLTWMLCDVMRNVGCASLQLTFFNKTP